MTPFGRPDAARLTLPLKPLCGPTVRVVTPLVPLAVRWRLLGHAERLKFGAVDHKADRGGMAQTAVVGNVTIAVPAVAVGPAANVRVLEPVVLAGLNDEAPGRPVAAMLTLPLKPLCVRP